MNHRHASATALLALLCTANCGGTAQEDPSPTDANAPQATYDPGSGKPTGLAHDPNHDGRVDSRIWLDGGRVVRAETDSDSDGKVDRWEYYDDEARLVKVGLSRDANGREDAWAYQAPDGSRARMDISGEGDGRVTRVEYYDHGRLISAESDEDGDGRPEKWERYQDGRLASLELDTRHGGVADRRLVYDTNGNVTVEEAAPSGLSLDSRSLPAGR